MATFVLEIRTEEIPANALPGARRQLAEGLGAALGEAGYEGLEITVLSTNRRLAILAGGLPARQPDRAETVSGPPVSVAFGADGAPTRAAEGFARKVGLEVGQLERVATDKGEYLSASVVHEGRATTAILAERVPQVIAALRFPKTMRWGDGSRSFVRPVHGVVALLDEDVVPVELFGIVAGRTTVGHRVHAPQAVELASASEYVERMREANVLVDPAGRRAALDARAVTLAAEVSCGVRPDPALVAEHVELVEYPGLLRGRIDERFLELPPEVVVTTLRHHQKCLILERDGGGLAPHFLAVVDRADDPTGVIAQGNEWVIGARLADAEFFFREDRRNPLAEQAPKLARLEFHRVLGSLEDKAVRAGELAGWLSDRVGAGVAVDLLTRVARLCKADLVTNMVGEFPELQGIMGGHYLRLDGEPEGVWQAARDHYTPVGFEGRLPGSAEGRLVGVADRMDTLAGLFAVGEQPTGSRDPFGLRRAAQGTVRIVAEAGWSVPLDQLADRALHGVAAAAGGASEGAREALEAFLQDRVRRYLVDVVGVAGDTAEAVLGADWTLLPESVARARALDAVRFEPAFRSLALAFKRVRNITDGQPDAPVEPTLLAEPAERELYDAAVAFHDRIGPLLAERRVDDAFAAMGPLAEVLDRFFVDVLVMTDDERIRGNRIALLKLLGRDFLTLADLSKLQIEGGD